MHTVSTRHGPVHYEERGRGAPLLLLHANPGDHRDFDAIAPALSENRRVIAPDWPGYGASPAPEPASSASAMLFAEVALDLSDALDLRGAIVLGNSVGGYAAVRLALERPERVAGLVLVDSGGFTPHNGATRTFCRVKGTEWVARAIATHFARYYLRAKNPHVQAILQRTEQGRRIPDRVAVDAAVWRSFLDPRHDLRDSARGLSAPTLVAWGAKDPVLPLDKDGRAAAASIPGATLEVFDTGHMPFAEAPELFLRRLRPFLASLA